VKQSYFSLNNTCKYGILKNKVKCKNKELFCGMSCLNRRKVSKNETGF